MSNSRTFLGALALVAATAGITASVVSQDTGKNNAMSAEQTEMMQKWTAYMTPGKEHAWLAEKVGNWNAVVKMWEAPGQEPSITNCTVEFQMLMDGRYLGEEYKGDTEFGPFHGMGCTGFDNMTKKFVNVWIDNMGTGISRGEGTYDSATKTLTWTAESPDFLKGGYKKVKAIERVIDANNRVFEQWDTDKEGKSYKNFEIALKRVTK